jgi:uncharacterized protein (TIGR03492 family)
VTPLFTILSNGHGEDAIGAGLVRVLQKKPSPYTFQAYPTVDSGNAYEGLGVEILGPRRVMPSGGFLLHHPALLVKDLRAGFLSMSWQQLRSLRGLKTDVLLTIGDVYALMLSSLVSAERRFYLQPLVSSYHRANRSREVWLRPNRFFMETFSAPERLLMRRNIEHIYVRDKLTAEVLRGFGLNNVSALGNPMLDALKGAGLGVSLKPPVVALLPGTRAHAPSSLLTMLKSLSLWPQATGVAAWAGGALPGRWPAPWIFKGHGQAGALGVLEQGEQRVYLFEGRFADVISSAHLALGTAGTANEQAASLGLPVVAFRVPPLYTEAYLHNQKRLLGAALTLAEPRAPAIAAALQRLWHDPELYARAAEEGKARMGAPGGSEAIAKDILSRLKTSLYAPHSRK